MTSGRHLTAQFAHASERVTYKLAVALAAQLKGLSLADVLRLLPLIAEHEPATIGHRCCDVARSAATRAIVY